MGNMGWIEIVLFYGVAIGFGAWQWWSVSKRLEKTKAEEARKRAEAESE